ncbi:hypothetical protein AC249_AIPGENE7138, partial [Exaiptasia diaphana]
VMNTFLDAMRKVVTSELKRVAAWRSPPSYWGILGYTSWEQSASESGQILGALDELLNECYRAIFLDRLEWLYGLAATQTNLGAPGRKNDLMGFRLFDRARNGVALAVDSEDLVVLCGDPKISNDTILGVVPGLPSNPVPIERLSPVVDSWVADLLPDLIIAGGRQCRRVDERLHGHLSTLESKGITVFRFGDLISSMKHSARASWSTYFEGHDGEALSKLEENGARTLVHIVRFVDELAAEDAFQKLMDCVEHQVEHQKDFEKDRTQMRLLWGLISLWIVAAHSSAEENLPGIDSNRAVARFIDVPRKKLPRLRAHLRQILEACLEALMHPL